MLPHGGRSDQDLQIQSYWINSIDALASHAFKLSVKIGHTFSDPQSSQFHKFYQRIFASTFEHFLIKNKLNTVFNSNSIEIEYNFLIQIQYRLNTYRFLNSKFNSLLKLITFQTGEISGGESTQIWTNSAGYVWQYKDELDTYL